MSVDYWILPFALLLLGFPRQWLRLGKKVIRSSAPRNPGQPVLERDAHGSLIRLKSDISKVRNWVDLARAATGAVAVNYACFAVEPGTGKSVEPKIFALKSVLLVIAVLVQSIRIESRVRLVTPLFFILGLSIGLIGLLPALFAFVTVWTFSREIPNAGGFLFAIGSLQIAFGWLLARGPFINLFLSAALAILPFLLSGMLKQPLVWLNKSSQCNQR